MGDDSQQGDEALADLSLFLFDKALTIGFWDEYLSSRDARLVGHKCPQDDVVALMQKELQEKAVEKIVHEIESMMKELEEKLDQTFISIHPLVVEARAEMSALEMRLFGIQSSVMDFVDAPRDPTNTNPLYPGTTDPYELLRFDCKRLANSYLHPLETLAAKMRLTAGLGVESSHLKPLSDRERAVDEVIVQANEGGRAIIGPAILKRLDEKSKKDFSHIDVENLKRILLMLKLLRGLENRPNVGYFYPRYFEEA